MEKDNTLLSDGRGHRGTPLTRSRPATPRVPLPPVSTDLDHVLDNPHDPHGSMDPGPLSAGSPEQSASSDRPLNVSDALSYLDSVKAQFSEQPEVYNKFLDIMKDFKSQYIDTPGVIERVSNLFHGHPALIQGFNTFLPAGYRIETGDNADPNYITVTTPAGTTTQATNAAFKYSGVGNRPPTEKKYAQDSVPAVSQETLKPALEFMAKIRSKYPNQPEVYNQFLSLLMETADLATQQSSKDIRGMESWSVACLSAKWPQEHDLIHRIMDLFREHTDIMRDFVQFLPDEQMKQDELVRIAELERSRRPNDEKRTKRSGGDVHGSGSTSGQLKRKRKEKEKEKETPPVKASSTKKAKTRTQSEGPSPALAQRQAAPPASPARAPPQPPPPQNFYPHHQQGPAGMAGPGQPSSTARPPNDFFERVKAFLDPPTYNEFLKLINLFTQDIINSTRLVREARTFLGETEYVMMLKDILGWDVNKERMAVQEETWTRPMGVLDRPNRNQLHLRYGSYRKLPDHEVNVQCSGRDEMCNSVLNDRWIAQPTFPSEDAGFFTAKKNQYEEALHRSEEERHEYDFHVEAIHRTIAVLEPLHNKIATMPPEERGNFKLKANLGGVGKAVHQRVIKKIYGRDIGNEVWIQMQEAPATAIPIVLLRLKQKHEEWKRAQREWDKVWREVDARNYHKSLDYQAVTFRAEDKKAITQKAFVTQIEAARDEQRVGRAALIDPLLARTRPRHQLEFVVDDPSVLQDTLKLAISFLDRTQGQVSLFDRRKIETFLRSFVPLFFMLDPVAFNAAFVPHHETVDDGDGETVSEDVEMASVNGGGSSSRSRNNKKGAGAGSGDLRKRLLKSEQAKSSRRTRAQEALSPSPSRLTSPTPSDAMQVDGEAPRAENGVVRMEKVSTRRKGTFYTNTAFYVLLRLLELLYSRLNLFKNLTKEKTDRSNYSSPALHSIRENIEKLADRLKFPSDQAAYFYELMLESCEKLFDNEVEQTDFEEMLRYMFGLTHAYKMFTIDKLIGALIKQVQIILSDSKSQDLYELLRKEREIPSPTTQDLINCRRNTERVLGPDENLFRMDWLMDAKTMTIQLIGKDDDRHDDPEAMTERWQAYIESFVSHHYTAGVPTSSTIRRPFLLRTKIPAPTGAMPDIIARGGLQIKVCVRTYRLFFVSGSEDVMYRLSSSKERDEARRLVEARNKRRQEWLVRCASGGFTDEMPKNTTLSDTLSKLSVVSEAPLAKHPQVSSIADGTKDAPIDVAMDAEEPASLSSPTTVKAPAEVPVAVVPTVAAPEPDIADIQMEDATPSSRPAVTTLVAPRDMPKAESAPNRDHMETPRPSESAPLASTSTAIEPLTPALSNLPDTAADPSTVPHPSAFAAPSAAEKAPSLPSVPSARTLPELGSIPESVNVPWTAPVLAPAPTSEIASVPLGAGDTAAPPSPLAAPPS